MRWETGAGELVGRAVAALAAKGRLPPEAVASVVAGNLEIGPGDLAAIMQEEPRLGSFGRTVDGVVVFAPSTASLQRTPD